MSAMQSIGRLGYLLLSLIAQGPRAIHLQGCASRIRPKRSRASAMFCRCGALWGLEIEKISVQTGEANPEISEQRFGGRAYFCVVVNHHPDNPLRNQNFSDMLMAHLSFWQDFSRVLTSSASIIKGLAVGTAVNTIKVDRCSRLRLNLYCLKFTNLQRAGAGSANLLSPSGT